MVAPLQSAKTPVIRSFRHDEAYQDAHDERRRQPSAHVDVMLTLFSVLKSQTGGEVPSAWWRC